LALVVSFDEPLSKLTSITYEAFSFCATIFASGLGGANSALGVGEEQAAREANKLNAKKCLGFMAKLLLRRKSAILSPTAAPPGPLPHAIH
jgi:hypothetical protein